MKQTDRLDRIEKNLDLFFKGIEALRKSQNQTDAQSKHTDEQILELRDAQKHTDGQILELRDAQKHTDGQILELRDAQKHTDGQILDLRNAQKQTDDLLKKTITEMRETDKRLEKKLNKIGENLGNIGIVQGEIAEDIFYRNVKHVFSDRGKRFSSVVRNLKKKGGNSISSR